jgi:hypothetical protein
MTWSPRASALLTVSVLVLASCSTNSVEDLKPGDCFDDPTANGEFIEEIETVPMVDCDDPHDNEVYANLNAVDGAFPGDDALYEEAVVRCLPLFESYVGSPYDTSRLDIVPITPLAEGWADGDRAITCVLYDLELNKLTGSMKSSGE